MGPQPTDLPTADAPDAPAVDRPEDFTGVPDQQKPKLSAGDPVSFTYKDSADNEVVRYGTVVEVLDNVNGHPEDGHTPGQPEQGARVAWLSDVSDPIPLDQLELSR